MCSFPWERIENFDETTKKENTLVLRENFWKYEQRREAVCFNISLTAIVWRVGSNFVYICMHASNQMVYEVYKLTHAYIQTTHSIPIESSASYWISHVSINRIGKKDKNVSIILWMWTNLLAQKITKTKQKNILNCSKKKMKFIWKIKCLLLLDANALRWNIFNSIINDSREWK